MKQLFLRLDAFLDSGINEKDDKDRLKHWFGFCFINPLFDLDLLLFISCSTYGDLKAFLVWATFKKAKKGMILVSILLSMMRRWSFHESQPTSYFFFLCCLSL